MGTLSGEIPVGSGWKMVSIYGVCNTTPIFRYSARGITLSEASLRRLRDLETIDVMFFTCIRGPSTEIKDWRLHVVGEDEAWNTHPSTQGKLSSGLCSPSLDRQLIAVQIVNVLKGAIFGCCTTPLRKPIPCLALTYSLLWLVVRLFWTELSLDLPAGDRSSTFSLVFEVGFCVKPYRVFGSCCFFAIVVKKDLRMCPNAHYSSRHKSSEETRQT